MELKRSKRLISKLLSSISILALLLTQLVLFVPVASAAVTAVTNVVATDPDTTINGIDGNDVRVTWTPASVSGATTFTGYTFYLVTASTNITIENSNTFTPYMVNLLPITMSTFNPPPAQMMDSSNNLLAAGSYKMCIRTGTSPSIESTLTCSAAFTITSETVTDTSKPFVDFIPVHTITAGPSAYLNIEVQDDQTTSQTFDTQGSGSYVKMFVGTDLETSENQDVCAFLSGKLFECEIVAPPAAGAPLEYRFEAKDATGNIKHVCPGSTSTSTATSCKASPFMATVAAAGSRSISGTITGGLPVAAVSSAKVFTGGFAIRAVTTDASGNYTLTGLPNNTVVDIVSQKDGFCTNSRNGEIIGTANLTGINLLLNQGSCTAAADGSGTQNGKPHVMFSGPPNFATGVPPNETIRVGFDMALNPSGINTTDATAAATRVYLTTDDGTTKIAGTVTYCENQAAAGCSAIPAMDTNTIVFDPTSDLTANTFYTLVILPTVVGENGQGVEGNKPGGGAQISFTTGGGAIAFTTQQFGTGGHFMPPFVSSTMPGPGSGAPPNTKVLLTFNEPMSSSTITTTNVKLIKKANGSTVTTTVSLDNNEKKVVTITPSAALATGRYEVQVLGAVGNASGITMRGSNEAAQVAFSSEFEIKGTTNTTAATIFPMLANNSTGVASNQGFFQFGFNQPMDPSTINSSKITITRGSTSVATDVKYFPGENNVYVIPTTVLAPSTAYTVTFANTITDLTGVAIAATTYTYTTGSTTDTTSPKLREFRADEFNGSICFNEPMMNDNQTGSNYSKSVINHSNLTLEQETTPGVFGGTDYIGSGSALTYDGKAFCVKVSNMAMPTSARGSKFRLTVNSAVTDLSSNGIVTASSANIIIVPLEDSSKTFGSFGNEGNMFQAPLVGDTAAAGGQFKPEGFGSFTAEQFGMGQADSAFPFNPTAGADSNVFQTRFTPNVALVDGDLIELTFPVGTGLTSAKPDTFSPFYADMNEFRSGTITFDATYDSDGVQVDTTNRTVTVKVDITGTPVANDPLTIDLRKITNPAIPKDPSSGGYTVGIKIKRSTETLKSKTSMPYFIMAGGTNTLNVRIYAGSVETPTLGATGSIFLHGGGPGGPMDKNVTLTNGSISAVDGTSGTQIQYTSLTDGCYFIGTEPFVTLAGTDYFGQMAPEPVCLSGSQTQTKNIILTSAATAGTAHNITVKLAGIANFSGADMDIFAGGPGRFVVKNLTGVTTPNASGYTISLPTNGMWFVGVGPGMPKGNSASTGAKPKSLPGVPCPPVDIIVSGVGGTSTATAGFRTPPCASFNSSTSTLTFTFATADKTVSGTVTDGTTGLANIEVFMHSQGFGAPVFTTTGSDGTFSLSLSDYGLYEIGARKEGLPPVFKPIDIRPDGSDAGSDPDIFFNGKQITGSNALVIKLKKGAYTISGKVLDANSNAISNAPVFAKNTTGDFVDGRTSADGSYTLFVDNGTWTVKAQLPPDSTATCGTFEATVVVASADMSNQNISPSATTCYTLSGTVSVGGTAQGNIPVFIEEWDSTNDRPAGGLFKPTSTNSSGVYSAKVTGSKTYRVGTWSPTYGELSATYAVATADKTDANLTAATTGTITFAFTGGTSSHEALIEVKNASDKHTRSSKTQKDLSSNVTMTVKAGTYNYFVKVFGVGDFTGSVASGATATIDLSASALLTLSGNVKDSAGSNLTGALITAINTTTGEIETTTSDSSGNYSMKLAAGTYAISESLAGYVSTAAATNATISANATFNIGGTDSSKTGPTKATSVISGTVTKATANGGGAVTEGAVSATNASSIVITVPINSDGTYQMPVLAGTWTLKAIAPNHVRTTASSADTVTTADTTRNITLTDDTSSEITVATSKSLSADSGGSVNDDQNTGMRLTAGPGTLETGSSDVALTLGRSADAPDTERYDPLGDRTYSVSATGSSSIKELNGRVDLQLNYTDVVAELPTGRTEADLTCAYYSEEAGEYIPVEGGFVVDAANNTITCSTDHFTDFAIVYSSVASTTTTTATTTTTTSSGGGGGGGGSATTVSATPKVEEVKSLAEKVVEEAVEVGASGVVEKEMSLQNTETKAYVTIDANTSVTTEDGKKYSGEIPVPTPATVDKDAPENMTYASSVYELGVADKTLKFSKKVKVVLPLKTDAQPGDKLAVYVLEGKAVVVEEGEESATESVWTKVADVEVKKLDSKYVVEFEVDHFSKYAVMEDAAKAADTKPAEETDGGAQSNIVKKASFSDTKSHWAADFIEDLYAKGIVKGYSGNAFKPDAEITRAEFTKIVITAFDIPILKASEITFIPFTDVEVSQWYAPYVQAAYIWKIVNGYEDDTFRPNTQINRAEAMKILLVAAKVQLGTPKNAGFKDVSAKDWFAPYVNYAAEKGIVSGYSNGKFGPGDNLQRGQVAKIVSLMLKMQAEVEE